MLWLVNADIKDMLHRKTDLIIYGASIHIQRVIDHFPDEKIEEKIKYIVDRDNKKDGTRFRVLSRDIKVVSLNTFVNESDIPSRYHMLIVIERYEEALQTLDQLQELDHMICYIWWTPFLSCRSGRSFPNKMEVPAPAIKRSIPKTIHYCWFGGGKLPNQMKENIASWRRTNPEFEIMEWNEHNFDVNAIPYTSEAYKRKKYSFVSDYARYEIILQNGGFYFDTDVELLKDISPLCSYRGFFSFEFLDLINSGSGFAAEKGDEVIREIRDQYLERSFLYADGSMNLTPCSVYETHFFEQRGIKIDNSFQIYKEYLIFPYVFFAPVNQITALLEMTENTFGIHKFDCSWFAEEEKKLWSESKSKATKFNERLIAEWKQEYAKPRISEC